MTFKRVLAALVLMAMSACSRRAVLPQAGPALATVEVNVAEPGLVTLQIFSPNGALVRTLLDSAYLGPGERRIPWDGRDNKGQSSGKAEYTWRLELRKPGFVFERAIASPGSAKGQVLFPAGLAVSEGREGPNLYVVDAGNGRIQILGMEGDFQREIRPTGSERGAFMEPWGIAQRGGELVMGDREARSLFKFTRHGELRGVVDALGPERSRLARPQDIAFDPFGNLLISDTGADRVLVIDPLGRLVLSLGGFGTGDGFFMRPQGVCADSTGNIFVADTGNRRIQKFSASGQWLKAFTLNKASGGPVAPGALVFSQGLLVAADAEGEALMVLDGEGNPLSHLMAKQGLGAPAGLALSSDGYLFLADSRGHQILRFRRKDQVSRESGALQLERP